MCSAPSTASMVSTCGQVRSVPRGMVQPWNSTISRFFAVSAATASYHFIRSWPSDSTKSIFSPATPQDFHSGSCASRCAWVASEVKFVQIHTPTCFACAYLTRVGIQLALQPASTSTYSQPIFAAKSVYFSCAVRLPALEPSDHQDQAARPGLIHDGSATFDGAARSVTKSHSVTVARSPRNNVRHGGAREPGVVSREAGRVTRSRWVLPFRVRRVPPYVPLRSDSVTSSHVSATWNSDGYPYSS